MTSRRHRRKDCDSDARPRRCIVCRSPIYYDELPTVCPDCRRVRRLISEAHTLVDRLVDPPALPPRRLARAARPREHGYTSD